MPETVSHTARISTVIEWPDNRPTDEVIAERMLAAALHNYHAALTTSRKGRAFTVKTWFDLTDEQRAFYLDSAIPQALQIIWKGR